MSEEFCRHSTFRLDLPLQANISRLHRYTASCVARVRRHWAVLHSGDHRDYKENRDVNYFNQIIIVAPCRSRSRSTPAAILFVNKIWIK